MGNAEWAGAAARQCRKKLGQRVLTRSPGKFLTFPYLCAIDFTAMQNHPNAEWGMRNTEAQTWRRAAEAQNLGTGDGWHREPSIAGAARGHWLGGGSEPPNRRFQNSDCRLGNPEPPLADCKMHEMRNRRSLCGSTVSRAKPD